MRSVRVNERSCSMSADDVFSATIDDETAEEG
jgi:hypothetical protein